MTTTTNLAVTKIDSSQAQKEVTANEAFDVFDAALSEISIAMSDAHYTLSSSTTPKEWQYATIKLTGTLTASRNVIVPTNKKQYTVVNATTGGFSVVVKTSAGSGVTIGSDVTANVRCDGTDVVVITNGTGSGNVSGPESSTDNHVVFFNGATGDIIKDSGLTLAGTNTGDETAETIGDLIDVADEKAAPVDADYIGLMDSAASNVLKKLSWANIKAALNSVFVQKTSVPVIIQLAASDEATELTSGTGKMTFRLPHAMTLTEVRASLTTAQTSGSIFTVDINAAGASVLSTKITVDNAEKTSTTAATAPVISTASLSDDAEITVDIDQIGDGTAKGLKITLIGTRSV